MIIINNNKDSSIIRHKIALRSLPPGSTALRVATYIHTHTLVHRAHLTRRTLSHFETVGPCHPRSPPKCFCVQPSVFGHPRYLLLSPSPVIPVLMFLPFRRLRVSRYETNTIYLTMWKRPVVLHTKSFRRVPQWNFRTVHFDGVRMAFGVRRPVSVFRLGYRKCFYRLLNSFVDYCC